MNYYKKYDENGALHYDWYKKVPWYKEVVDIIVDFVKGSCVDLGCGDGLVCKLLSEKKSCSYILGIDNNKKGIELAKKLAPKADYRIFDLDRPFDVLVILDYMVCLNTIEHLKNPENIVQIFKNFIYGAGIVITDKKTNDGKIKRSHTKEYSIEELEELFKNYKTKRIKFKNNSFIGLKIYK